MRRHWRRYLPYDHRLWRLARHLRKEDTLGEVLLCKEENRMLEAHSLWWGPPLPRFSLLEPRPLEYDPAVHPDHPAHRHPVSPAQFPHLRPIFGIELAHHPMRAVERTQ